MKEYNLKPFTVQGVSWFLLKPSCLFLNYILYARCTTYDSQTSESNVPCTTCGAQDSERVKRHYRTKHASKFDGIDGQLQFDKIEQFKKSLSRQKVFHAHEKDTELIAKRK